MLEIFQVRWFLAEKSPSLEIGSIYRNCRPSGISFAGKERVTDGAVGREIAQPPWSIHVGWKGGTVRWLTRWFSRFSRLQSPSPWGNFQIKLLNLKRETWAACCMWWQRRPSSMCSLVDSSPRGPPEYLNIAHSHCQPRHTAAVSMYFSTDWPVKKLQILFKCIIPFLKACCSQHLHLKAQRTHPCTCTQPRVLTRHTHTRGNMSITKHPASHLSVILPSRETHVLTVRRLWRWLSFETYCCSAQWRWLAVVIKWLRRGEVVFRGWPGGAWMQSV